MYATSSGRALKGYPTPLRVNKACEENLLAVFASLRRCIECGPLTRAEVYLGNIRGRLIFLPGLPMRWSFCGGWSLDLCSLEASLSKKAYLQCYLQCSGSYKPVDAINAVRINELPSTFRLENVTEKFLWTCVCREVWVLSYLKYVQKG